MRPRHDPRGSTNAGGCRSYSRRHEFVPSTAADSAFATSRPRTGVATHAESRSWSRSAGVRVASNSAKRARRCLLRSSSSSWPLGGDSDEGRPPVIGVSDPGDQVQPLQALDQLRHRGLLMPSRAATEVSRIGPSRQTRLMANAADALRSVRFVRHRAMMSRVWSDSSPTQSLASASIGHSVTAYQYHARHVAALELGGWTVNA